MSQRPISLSPDLKRLRDEGYDIEVRANYLLLKDVPYVNANREIKRGILVSTLNLAGDQALSPDTHALHFAGEYPCTGQGARITQIENASNRQELSPGLIVDHYFSAKPVSGSAYPDYYAKMTNYVAILSGPAQVIDPGVTARTYPVIMADESEPVFNYLDTASSRAGIGMATAKLEAGSVAIVGLGGTGSYVLDLVAKTPVKEIHLFDGDGFRQHNAFRSPGAPSAEELRGAPAKVLYFKERYSPMRRGIIEHNYYLTDANANELAQMEFVFLCVDAGENKKHIVDTLVRAGIPFVDVGMGLELVDSSIGGLLRVTTATREHSAHLPKRIPLERVDAADDYGTNIQIADLNALNAALAVIKWKKLRGFYLDFDREHNATFTIDGNMLTNDDKV
jgi:hypothetical protein